MKVLSGLILFVVSVLAFRWSAGEVAIQLWGAETRAEIIHVGRNEPRGRLPAYRARYEFVSEDATRVYGTAPVRRGSEGGWLRVKYLRHDATWNTPATGWYAGALMVLFGVPAWGLSFWSAHRWRGAGGRRALSRSAEGGPGAKAPMRNPASILGKRVGSKRSRLPLSLVLAGAALGLNLVWFATQERRAAETEPESDPALTGRRGTEPTRKLARGASIGNQVNGSAVAFEGNSVYGPVWNDTLGGAGAEAGLYCFSGGVSALVGKSGETARIFRGVQVLDGWIYYLGMEGIHRIRKDGSQHATLTRTRASSMAVVENAVYFQNELLGDALYRINTSGGGERPVVRESTGAYCVADDGWIYFVNRTDDGRAWRMRADGRGSERFLDRRIGLILAMEGVVWFTDLTDGSALYRSDSSASNGLKVFEGPVVAVLPVRGDLALVLADGTIVRINKEGTERTVLANGVSNLLEHEGILYLTKGLQTQILHRVTLEGEALPALHLAVVSSRKRAPEQP